MKKDKVFVGPGNIAGNAMHIAKSLRLVGIKAKSFSYKKHPFGYKCDLDGFLFEIPYSKNERTFIVSLLYNKYCIRLIHTTQKISLFFYSLLFYNTYIFISHETFLNNNKDLKLLKFLGKRIAFLFVGCPERNPKDLINQTDRGLCSFCSDKGKQKFLKCFDGNFKKNKIIFLSNLADIIFTHRDTASFILDQSKINSFYCIADSNITINEIYEKFALDKEITICHFPSNKLLKETNSVHQAIINLQKTGYKFKFISEPLPHTKVIETLKYSQILIDQFSIGHGLLGVEGMANGCVVICRTAKWFKEDFPQVPVVSCEPEEIANVLVKLISDKEEAMKIALKSFNYYQVHHAPEQVGLYYKKKLGLS